MAAVMSHPLLFPGLSAAALLLEAAAGYPGALFRAIRHPVVWAGALIGWLDRTLNRDGLPPVDRKLRGVLAVAVLLAAAILPAAALQAVLPWPVLAVLACHPAGPAQPAQLRRRRRHGPARRRPARRAPRRGPHRRPQPGHAWTRPR